MAETPPREPDWSLLYRSLFASEEQLPEAKVREIMTNTSLKDLREWMFYGHPLFHEAVEQRSDTGFIIWSMVLERADFFKLVFDPTYIDHRGKTAIQRSDREWHPPRWERLLGDIKALGPSYEPYCLRWWC